MGEDHEDSRNLLPQSSKGQPACGNRSSDANPIFCMFKEASGLGGEVREGGTFCIQHLVLILEIHNLPTLCYSQGASPLQPLSLMELLHHQGRTTKLLVGLSCARSRALSLHEFTMQTSVSGGGQLRGIVLPFEGGTHMLISCPTMQMMDLSDSPT